MADIVVQTNVEIVSSSDRWRFGFLRGARRRQHDLKQRTSSRGP